MRGLVLSFLLLSATASCTLHEGRTRDLPSSLLYDQGRNLEVRGDLIGAEHLLSRARVQGAGSLHGVLSSLELASWSDAALLEALAGDLGVARPERPLPPCPP